ncbi:hypothetical protein NQ318_009562 [Aromia moschata]|uniref:HTH CENPB-type domain-containing protein n=1 Tax=Aromia moschata TaxID=1265417 RepID=A0AAV8Y9Z1_9CUCU|nr:hypothetical protein NQ318_009562 [Aromia moschata]
MAPFKRPHKVITLSDKLKILNFLENGKSIRCTAEHFNVAKSTVGDIKNNQQKMKLKRECLRKAENPEMEQMLYQRFLQQRDRHLPISGEDDFLASSGWLDTFKVRHGIRLLKVLACGERIYSDTDAVQPFRRKYLVIICKVELSDEQVYNADESAIFWRVLPDTTWVHESEKSAPGRNVSKDLLTFMPCCNAAGSHKLPIFVIGKSHKPRAFKNSQIHVVYNATNKLDD